MSDHHHHSEGCHSAGCHHGVPSTPQQVRSLRIALVFIASFSIAELWVSFHTNSLSLMADAGHMACDVGAIALSLWAASQSQPDVQSGRRADINPERLNAIAALVNGVLLLIVSGWLGWEAIEHLRSLPTEILSQPVAITAAVGLGMNGLNAYLLHSHADDNLNMRGAFLHMVADASSCLGVLIGAVLIANYQWYWADGVVSGAIALLITSSAIPLIRQSWSTLNPKALPTN
ncbi:cation diffusion facilitator family transporter [cf. Phormidesmis sp. LEGE 11477]|uniref:cation diffusion facilitator family transporter n=1 Tax=cf. Phormidesmis sp. LEGE 11477 TaxID=1828680 RepID=UPI0018823A97|nr:cation diffusion facilitator family transporter [cf. Phormidesmis sp. LEGE 11477]MBE9062531.1 cation transporter [cf. Phormidesmis sp. LEGE 11477]